MAKAGAQRKGMQGMKIVHIVGARPNFIKAAPVFKAMKADRSFSPVLIHTGQHYDRNMSDVFFEDLDLPRPDIYLGVGSQSHSRQTAEIMIRLEQVFRKIKPHLVMVYGDVNSTLSGALVARKMNIPVAHVEAGLRSYDRAMPEEINRVITDVLSDFLFTPSVDADKNLIKEGIARKKIFFVGNTMIDSLVANRDKIQESSVMERLHLEVKKYVVVTLHRPSNVDDKKALKNILGAIHVIASQFKVIFPVHPRTAKNIKSFSLDIFHRKVQDLLLVPPLRYIDFLKLIKESYCVLSDSGGIQEETTFLGVPCFTLRENTERPITVTYGTNTIVGTDTEDIINSFNKISYNRCQKGRLPYWDGKAAKRIVEVLRNQLG